MTEAPRYRHELKYEIDPASYLALRQRLRPVMKPDGHALSDGRYLIRSVYFDNHSDKALREKITGADRREKFRVRYYNDDFSYITLEKKEKRAGLCRKTDAALTEDECRALLSGDTAWMAAHAGPLVRELYVKMKTQLLRPRVLVSYLREPYVFAAGNVRVTFDSRIRTSLWHRSFLEREVHDVSATDAPGDMVLEVKFGDSLPDGIAHLIPSEALRQRAFSKYGVCRRFG